MAFNFPLYSTKQPISNVTHEFLALFFPQFLSFVRNYLPMIAVENGNGNEISCYSDFFFQLILRSWTIVSNMLAICVAVRQFTNHLVVLRVRSILIHFKNKLNRSPLTVGRQTFSHVLSKKAKKNTKRNNKHVSL